MPEPRVSSTSTPLNGEVDAATAGEVIPAGKPLPYDDGGLIGAHLIRKLEPEQFVAALRVMISHAVEAGLEVPLPSKR